MTQKTNKSCLVELIQRFQGFGFIPNDDFFDYEYPTLCAVCQKVDCVCETLKCICDREPNDCEWPEGPRCYCLQCASLIKECKCKIK